MLELTHVPPPSSVDHAGLRDYLVALADGGAWYA